MGPHHRHAHVSLFVKGEQIAIPAGIGVTNPVVANGYISFDLTKCYYETPRTTRAASSTCTPTPGRLAH